VDGWLFKCGLGGGKQADLLTHQGSLCVTTKRRVSEIAVCNAHSRGAGMVKRERDRHVLQKGTRGGKGKVLLHSPAEEKGNRRSWEHECFRKKEKKSGIRGRGPWRLFYPDTINDSKGLQNISGRDSWREGYR